MNVGLVLSWSDVSVGPFDMDLGCVPPMVRCESLACLYDMYVGCVPRMVRCKCWAGHSD